MPFLPSMDLAHKHVVVVGSGAIGLSCAWAFAKAGAKVQVVEANSQSAMETSYANGAQLSACNSTPWSAPGALTKALRWLGKPDAPLLWVPKLQLEQWRWLLEFALYSRPTFSAQHQKILLLLGLHARDGHQQMESDMQKALGTLEYGRLKNGILHIYRKTSEFTAAQKEIDFYERMGLARTVLDARGCVQKEPSLNAIASDLVGGILTPTDGSGDIHQFCKSLAQYLSLPIDQSGLTYPVEFIYQTHAQLVPHSGRVDVLLSPSGLAAPHTEWRANVTPDLVIVSTASHTDALLKPLGLRTGIYPVKGYAMNYTPTKLGLNPTEENAQVSNWLLPETSISDDDYKIVWTRLGDTLRAAGTAEISGEPAHILRAERCGALLEATHKNFPNLAGHAQYWAGLRPMTPSNVPFLAASPKHTNLIVCSGHGSLGWTMMGGAGLLCKALVQGEHVLQFESSGKTLNLDVRDMEHF